MADQNASSPSNTASSSTPAQSQAGASTSTAAQSPANNVAAAAGVAATSAAQAQPVLNNEMLAIVQALVRMQNGGQIDPALSQNAAVQHLYQLVKSGKLNQQQLLQVKDARSSHPPAWLISIHLWTMIVCTI